MQRKTLYRIAVGVLLSALLLAAWWGWSKAGLAVLQLRLGIC